jgi:UDP-N-acetylglucosamine 4,6-dehydratase
MKYLITGGTGSLGTHLAKRLLAENEEVTIFSRDEYKQRRMMNEVKANYIVGDVRNEKSITDAIKGIDYVIHTAAMKHVPVGEEQPEETIMTNVLGTINVIRACKINSVKKCILTATDKGCHPVNLYGATKLCGEKLMTATNIGSETKFASVRYGNVIGSRGSIIETILKEKPKELTITDERMTRFWLTLDQACDLVFLALSLMGGGEVFIPKIPSMRVVDMFNALAPETKLIVKGMRPGEKLHESLVNKDESIHTKEYDTYFVIESELLGCEYSDRIFEYTSENAKRLTKEEFLKLI